MVVASDADRNASSHEATTLTGAQRLRNDGVPVALLFVMTAATVWLRVQQAHESLWLDELHTAWVALGPWAAVGARSVAGNQSPVFFALEWTLAHAFGASELTLRLPSLIGGGLLVVTVFALARAWTGSAWLALVPAWLVAVDPQAIYYGTEARPYALIQLLGLLHVATFAALVHHPTRVRRALCVAGAGLLFHLHYTTGLLFAGELAWYAWARARGRAAYTPRAIALDATLTVLLMAPAAPALLAIAARRQNWAKFVDQQPPWVAVEMLPWAWTALIGTALVAIWRRVRPAAVAATGPDGSHDRMVAFDGVRCALCWLVVPLLLAWAATASDIARLMWPRYVAASAPAAMILLALALRDMPARRLRAIASVALIVAGTADSYAVRHLASAGRLLDWRTDDWREAVTWLNGQPHHADGAVLLRSDLIETDAVAADMDSVSRSYAMYPLHSLYPLDRDEGSVVALQRNQPAAMDDRTVDRVNQADIVWLVYNGGRAQEAQSAAAICRRLGERSDRAWGVVGTRSFGTVHVALLGR